VLKWQENNALRATNIEDRKRAHRAYQDLVLELTKGYALASASDAAAAIRNDVGFFQTIRAAIAKSTDTGSISQADRTFAVQQLIDRAVASTEIIGVLRAAGIETPDISILSDEFLAEVKGLERKNLALEALRKLLYGEIKSRLKTNVVESRSFSKRLEEAIARYHTNAISAAEMLNELIALAKDLQAARKRGEEQGLSEEELAFYDALAQNDSAVQVLGDEKLRIIAHEPLEQLRQNATVDWHKRESARAKMRVLVKRILKKYGYPPILAEDAVKLVLEQAEALLRQMN
jgi:type I restriction enzyme, R subunit